MSKLQEVATAPGPFASVYCDASHDTEDAAKVAELRWRGLRDQLADQGAPEETLAALDEAVSAADPPVGKAGRVLIASGAEVLVDQILPVPPPADVTRFSSLPDLLPLASYLPPPVPHVVVVADSSGADLHSFDGRVDLVETVRGKQHPLHKTGGGGWAHKRLQQRVEDTVKHNVKQVADEVERLVREVRAELVVLGGEVQARSAVRHELDLDDGLLVEVEGTGLAEGTDDEEFDNAVRALIAQRQQQHDAEVVERFRAELGRDGLAVEGLAHVTEALRQANVDTLVVNTDVLADQLVWTSGQPDQVGVDEAGVRQVVDDPAAVERNRADDALARAAAATGANVVVGDGIEVLQGVGAILRHRP
ncbi:Vms1/Ankzf1 family peptidyl-tRNA hydrolase [Lentzea rhizosphaerae]|uniref:Vms1/Ankzf1 family peptidyl-tRNA hydrolase n=1 Tax=Lentzea rhizosphaerae TaxID=2041025 RepID=A0ABV8C595_9PSEU